MQGRVFTGQEAVGLKLVDAIGGEDEAVDWLRRTHNIDKRAKVVDWKPESSSTFGLLGSLGAPREGPVRPVLGRTNVGPRPFLLDTWP